MADLATLAAEAYLSGWALSQDSLTERARAGCAAAVSLALEHPRDPGVLEVSLQLGKLEGTWKTVYDRRGELEAGHIRRITAIWRRLVKRLDAPAFIAAYRHQAAMPAEAAGDTPDAKDKAAAAAAAAALAWLRQILDDPEYADLAAAIITALADAMAEGKTATLAVAADQAAADGFSWDLAYAAMRAGLDDLEGQAGIADPWVQGILGGAARDVGRVLADAVASDASDAEIAAEIDAAIAGEDVAALDLTVDYGMGQFMGQGALDLAAAEGILLDWLTAADARVCASPCQENEDNGPYDPSAFPDLPGHPRCRCCSSPASPLRYSAFADFLVPP